MTLFAREDLIDALRELIAELQSEHETAGIRLVGGAALALRYFDRPSTQDLDALYVRPGTDEAVTRAADRIADRRGWDHGWLNFEVTNTGAEPLYGRSVEWNTIHDDDGIVIQIASPETLLAMKLRANRPGRDTDDIRQLLAICDIHTVEEADDFYAAFYPGEALTDRAWRMVTAILEAGPLAKPSPPKPIEL